MGEHKHNPTAIAAKKGEITPIVKPVYDKKQNSGCGVFAIPQYAILNLF